MCEDTRITNTNSAEMLGINALTDSLVVTNGRLMP